MTQTLRSRVVTYSNYYLYLDTYYELTPFRDEESYIEGTAPMTSFCIPKGTIYAYF